VLLLSSHAPCVWRFALVRVSERLAGTRKIQNKHRRVQPRRKTGVNQYLGILNGRLGSSRQDQVASTLENGGLAETQLLRQQLHRKQSNRKHRRLRRQFHLAAELHAT
jgi:hypothetical protein